MSELARAFYSRSPVILNNNDLDSFGIQAHPENYQSPRFKHWLTLCKANDVDKLKADMTEYLLGKDSIKEIDDLGKEWSKTVSSFLALGAKINKENSVQIIKESNLDKTLSKDNKTYAVKRMAIADTITSLAFLKKLSDSSNMDYLTVLRIMTFVERSVDSKVPAFGLNPSNYFLKPVLLHPWFSLLDPCGIKQSSTPFPFLEEAGMQTRAANKKIKGCINEDCTCKPNNDCVDQSKCCAKPRIDIIDLMIVKDYTKCYKAGDLSYIKNVMEGENLTTKHRRFEREEELIETEEDVRAFEERYLQTEEKASLQKETESVIKHDTSFDAGLTTNSSFGMDIKAFKLGFGTNSTTNISSKESKALTEKEIVNTSKDIIDRATKQLEEKVRKLVSTKRIFETEETNEHTFNNSTGGNLTGQYLYVNKTSRAQVYKYAKKPVLDIILPEPAALYDGLLTNKFPGVKPVKPAITPGELNSQNYLDYVVQYGIKDIPTPPEMSKELVIEFNGGTGDPHKHLTTGGIMWSGSGVGTDDGPKNFTVPPGYATDRMETYFSGVSGNGHALDISISVSVASTSLSTNITNSNLYSAVLPPLEGNQAAVIFHSNITYYSLSLKVFLKLKADELLKWQLPIYFKIMDAYNKSLAEYQKAKEEFDLKEAELKKERCSKNPFINRETEKTELKRMVISYISCQFFDQFDAMKNRVKPCGYREMNIREAEEQGKFIQFFEQAFDWNLITYLFYPYFWGKKCSWADKLKEESTDLIFEKFLAAGSCRVLIPIRESYFDYMAYFLTYGEIWGGTGMPPLPNDPHYVSLAQELKEQKQNYYAEREGTIDTVNGTNTVTLNNTDYYWDYGDPTIPTPAGLNTLNIEADLEREIILDFKTYKIIDIQPNPAVTTNDSWIITLDRNYERATATNMKWSTGAVFVGAPWEFTTPTTLTFLREKSNCLPCYPLKKCKEA